MSLDTATPSSSPTIRFSVIVVGGNAPGGRTPLRVPHRDEIGSVLFELHLVPAPDPTALDRPADPVLGALVIADGTRPGDCAPLVADLEARGLPFAVVVEGRGRLRRRVGRARRALGLGPAVPVLVGDHRDQGLVPRALAALTERVLSLMEADGEPAHRHGGR
jgi:hypothetical protein